MNPTEQAARWLADVPRYNPGGCGGNVWLHESDALAHIAAPSPVDDLVERLLTPCQNEHTYDADKEEAADGGSNG